jgi:hypothetical protein
VSVCGWRSRQARCQVPWLVSLPQASFMHLLTALQEELSRQPALVVSVSGEIPFQTNIPCHITPLRLAQRHRQLILGSAVGTRTAGSLRESGDCQLEICLHFWPFCSPTTANGRVGSGGPCTGTLFFATGKRRRSMTKFRCIRGSVARSSLERLPQGTCCSLFSVSFAFMQYLSAGSHTDMHMPPFDKNNKTNLVEYCVHALKCACTLLSPMLWAEYSIPRTTQPYFHL